MARKLFALNFVTVRQIPQIDVVEGPGRVLSATRTGGQETGTRNVTHTGTITVTETQCVTKTGTITQTTTGSRVRVSVTHREQLVPESPPPLPVTFEVASARSKDGRREAAISAVEEIEIGPTSASGSTRTSEPEIVAKGVALGRKAGKAIVDTDRDKDTDDDEDGDSDRDKDKDDDRGEDTDDDTGVRFSYEDLAVKPPLAPEGTRGRARRRGR